MKTHRSRSWTNLDPMRTVMVLALVAVGAFLAEHVRPGHHVHLGPDGPRHHHHAFVGDHTHDSEATDEHAHHATPEREPGDPDGEPPEAPGLQGLLTISALMTPSAEATVSARPTLAPGTVDAHAVAPLRRRAARTGGPRAPPRLG